MAIVIYFFSGLYKKTHIYIYIYTCSPREEGEHSRERINCCHSRNVKPFNRIDHSVADSVKFKQITTFNSYTLNSLPYVGIAGGCTVMLCHRADVKLAGFRSQFNAPHVSSDTDEFWYNETACLWMTIYINIILYVYIYVCVLIYIYIYVVRSKSSKPHLERRDTELTFHFL